MASPSLAETIDKITQYKLKSVVEPRDNVCPVPVGGSNQDCIDRKTTYHRQNRQNPHYHSWLVWTWLQDLVAHRNPKDSTKPLYESLSVAYVLIVQNPEGTMCQWTYRVEVSGNPGTTIALAEFVPDHRIRLYT